VLQVQEAHTQTSLVDNCHINSLQALAQEIHAIRQAPFSGLQAIFCKHTVSKVSPPKQHRCTGLPAAHLLGSCPARHKPPMLLPACCSWQLAEQATEQQALLPHQQ
jgi:hypothetical protein